MLDCVVVSRTNRWMGWCVCQARNPFGIGRCIVLVNGSSYGEMRLRNGTVCKVLSIRSLGRARAYMRTKSEGR